MAHLELPVERTLPSFSYQVQLDGTIYTLRYTFNDRMGKWFLDLRTEIGDPIVEGIPIVSDWDLFGRFRDDRLPPGNLFAFDTSGLSVDPGRYDLGERVSMIYEEEETA